MLEDTYNRSHNYLRISLTDNCNLRCFYCMPEEEYAFMPNQQLMQADEMVSIAKIFIANGVNKIRLTGGEPLVRKDAAHIIRALGALDVELTITTNATRVHHFIEDFEASRYRYLHISCHGNNDVIALTLEQYDNLSFSKAVGSKLDGRRLFISACGATTRNLAECLFQEAECRSLAGPKSNINFDDAAIFWTSFYHLMFKREAKSMSTRNIIGSSMVLGWALAEQFSLFYKSKDGNLIEQTLRSDASVETRLESIIRGGL